MDAKAAHNIVDEIDPYREEKFDIKRLVMQSCLQITDKINR